MYRFSIVLSLTLLVSFASLVLADIPKLINYQGMLTDDSGIPLTDTVDITFIIYDDPGPVGGNIKWDEIQYDVPVINGLFNVILGSVNPINLDFTQNYWLDITVEGEHMPERLRFTSVGYSYRALVADSASTVAPGSGSNWSVSDSVLYTNRYWGIARGGAGNVLNGSYVNTHVNLGVACTTGSSSPNAFYCTVSGGRFNSALDGDATVGGGMDNSATCSFSTIGGGSSNFACGKAATISGGEGNVAYGRHSTVPGGYQDSAAGYCSFAAGYRAKALHTGSFVWADSTDGDFSSVYANEFAVRASSGMRLVANSELYGGCIDNQAGVGDGLRAYADVSKGVYWAALYAVNYGTSPAIYADGGSDTAAYFNGSIVVTGNVYKSALASVIDHPLDPANKYLYHSGVESPDMMNIYNGNVALDGNGEAQVDLPEWFEALNRDFRYQLTAIGQPSPNLYVAREISGNSFEIAGGEPGLKVSWQVTGIRQDRFAEKNRIPVEEEKPVEQRGKYLHPKAYDLPETMGINYSDKKELAR